MYIYTSVSMDFLVALDCHCQHVLSVATCGLKDMESTCNKKNKSIDLKRESINVCIYHEKMV